MPTCALDCAETSPLLIPCDPLPVQLQSPPRLQPAQKLALALLLESLRDAQAAPVGPSKSTTNRYGRLRSRRREQRRAEARAWLADTTVTHPYSFSWVCLALDITPEAARSLDVSVVTRGYSWICGE